MPPDTSSLENRLTEIETRLSLKLDNLIDRFEAVNNGAGFPRCSERGARLIAIERDITDLKRKQERSSDESKDHQAKEVTRAEFVKLEETCDSLRNTLVGIILAGIFITFVGIVIKVWVGGI